jgi:nucleoside-diphosphate-sugar epimerase
LLKAAHKYGPNIKNITFVGSINAITDGTAEAIANRVYTEQDWLPYTTEDARRLQNDNISYCVAKKESEQFIWKYVETEKPHFSVTVFCPTLLIGPALHHVDNMKSINFTSDVVYMYIDGAHKRIPQTHFPAYVSLSVFFFWLTQSIVNISLSLPVIGRCPRRSPFPRSRLDDACCR